MSRREYRVIKITLGDDTEYFEVEYRSNANGVWLTACIRDTLELAKIAIITMKNEEVVSREVLYVE